MTERSRVFCVPVGAISLRIPTLGISFDGSVKLALGGGVAFCGQGHMVYGDGDAYIGEFLCGQRHGWGELLRADGSKICGHWTKDMPIVDSDSNFLPSEQQRVAQLQRSLCDWVSATLATASVSPLSSEEMRVRTEACQMHPPHAPPSISDSALTSNKTAKEAEMLLIQRMSTELQVLRKQAGDTLSLSNSIEMQRSELASASIQLQHAHKMQGTLQASMDTTDRRLQVALAALAEAQQREQKLLQDISVAVADSSAFKSQLLHMQNLLDAAQETNSHHKSKVVCAAPFCNDVLFLIGSHFHIRWRRRSGTTRKSWFAASSQTCARLRRLSIKRRCCKATFHSCKHSCWRHRHSLTTNVRRSPHVSAMIQLCIFLFCCIFRASPHFSRSHAACRERFANFRSRGQKP